MSNSPQSNRTDHPHSPAMERILKERPGFILRHGVIIVAIVFILAVAIFFLLATARGWVGGS